MRVADNRIATVLGLYRTELAGLYSETEAKAIARTVFHERMDMDAASLELHKNDALSESELLQVYGPIKRLAAGEPLQYVLGQVHFHGLTLRVAPGVLIPRPETEELVDHVVRSSVRPSRIVDIGTGSGCIALALKQAFPNAQVQGMDVSDAALVIARGNGVRSGLNVEWALADVLDPAFALPAGTDLLVSNPPYVPRSEETDLTVQVRAHEPHLALFVDDTDPLLFYRRIGELAWASLAEGGSLWFEGHYKHAPAVGGSLRSMGFRKVDVLNDMSGNHRFIHAVK